MNSNFYTNFFMMGKYLYYRGIENGERVQRKIPCQPSLFTPMKVGTPSGYTDFDGNPLYEIGFGSPKDAREYVKLQGSSNMSIFGNTKFEYDMINDQYPAVNGLDVDPASIKMALIDIETECSMGFPDIATANEAVNAITIHLNGRSITFGLEDFDVNAIEDENLRKYIPQISYYKMVDEYTMLKAFVAYIKKMDIDIISGWNSEGFDIPYLVNRIRRLLGEEFVKQLSPWGKIDARSYEDRFGGTVETYEISGIEHIDYKELYRKFTYTQQESYALDNILFVELEKRKVDYSEVSNLHTLYKTNHQKFIEYNLWDVWGMVELEIKMRLLELACTIAYRAKVNYSDVFTQVRMWDALTCNYIKNVKKVLPSAREIAGKSNGKFEGAFVKPPQTGFHKWVVSMDLNSLYPHLIMQYAISPENKLLVFDGVNPGDIMNIVEAGGVGNIPAGHPLTHTPTYIALTKAIEMDGTLCSNGAVFKRRMGFLPEILEGMYEERKAMKKKKNQAESKAEMLKKVLATRGATDAGGNISKKGEELLNLTEDELAVISTAQLQVALATLQVMAAQYENKQMAAKINLNSAYGVLGNVWCRWFDVDQAEGVTLSGQTSLRWVERAINKYLNGLLGTNIDYILYEDTDSVYISLGALVDKVFKNGESKETIVNFLDKFVESKLQKIVDDAYQQLATHTNAYAQKMFMKRESIADGAVFLKKKRYMLNVIDNEGVRYATPKLKVLGTEAVRSTTPKVCKEAIKKATKLIFDKGEDEVVAYIEEFRKKFYELPVEQIARPTGVHDIDAYVDRQGKFKPKTPMHVRAAINYNKLLKRHALDGQYELIKSGDKIKFVNLRTPNKFGMDVIGFLKKFPTEVGLTRNMIDMEEMFSTTFHKSMKATLDVMDWKSEESNDLSSLFS